MPRFYKEKKNLSSLRTKGFFSWYHLISPPAKRSGHSKSDNGLTAAIYLKFSFSTAELTDDLHQGNIRGVFQPPNPFSIGFPWLLLPFIVSTKYLFPIIPVFFCVCQELSRFIISSRPQLGTSAARPAEPK